MKDTKTEIVFIDDNRKETDPTIVQLKIAFPGVDITLKNKAQEGLDYVLSNQDKQLIVLLDYDLGKGEPNGTAILKSIREKTSLIYIIIITANNAENIPHNDLVDFVNNEAFAFLSRTEGFQQIKAQIDKALHSMSARVDSVLENWIKRHGNSEKPYLRTTSGQVLTLADVLVEIRAQSEIGKKLERNILMLAIDLLTRKKENIND